MGNKQTDDNKKYVYDAFISYRHTELDIAVAKKLHRLLESYRIPKSIAKQTGMKKINRVFRDQEELPTSGNLSMDIQNALENSKYLIVICSPNTPKSKWCCQEIESFRRIHGNNRILSLLIEGEPDDSFPRPLRFHMERIENPDGTISEMEKEVEPLAADIRGKSLHEMWKRLKVEKLRILAPMLSVKFDDLKQRHREQFIKKTAGLAMAASIVFAGFGSFALYQSNVISAQSMQLKKNNEEISLKNTELTNANQKLKEQMEETEKQRDLAQKNGDEAVKQAKTAEENANLAMENEKKALLNLHEAEIQRALAQTNAKIATDARKRAEEQRDQALKNQSLFLADLSRQQMDKGDKVTGMLLALNALPGDIKNPDRPYVGEAESALYNSIYKYTWFSIVDSGDRFIKARTRIEHNGINYAELSNDGKYVLTHSDSPNSVKVCDADTGRSQYSLTGDIMDTGNYRSLFGSFASNNIVIVQDSNYDQYKLVKSKIFAHDLAADCDLYNIDNVNYSMFSRESKRLLIKKDDGTVSINSVEDGKEIKKLLKTDVNIVSKFSNDGSKLVIYSPDASQVYAFNADTGDKYWGIDTKRAVQACTLNSDGTLLGVIYKDGIEVYDLQQNRVAANYKGDTLYPPYYEFTGDSSKFVCVTGSDIIVMRTNDGKADTYKYDDYVESANAVKMTPDSKKIIIGGGMGQAKIFDLESGKELALLKQSDESYLKDYCDVQISPDGKTAMTYSMANKVKLWSIQYGEQIAELDKQTGRVECAGFDKNGKRLFIAAPSDGVAAIWDIGKPERVTICATGTGKVIKVEFGQGGKILKSYTHNSYLDTFNADTGEYIDEKHLDLDEMAAEKSHDMKTTAVIDGQKVKLSGDKTLELVKHTGAINSVKFSMDDSKVITASKDKTAIIWDIKTGAPLLVLGIHPAEVTEAEFSPDGNSVITVSGNNAYIWSCEDGHQIAVLDRHTGKINSVEYSPDGRLIATASYDFTVRIWDAKTGVQLKILNKHTDIVNHARFSPDGKRIVSSSYDKTARVWDVDTGSEIALLDMHTSTVNDAIFNPDGTKVATASADKTAIVWTLFKDTKELMDYAEQQLKGRELTGEESRRFYIGE